MDLFLLRHGIAAELGAPGAKTDAERPLTAEGRRKLRGVAAAMRLLKLEIDHVFSSPLVRARQTAEIIARELRTSPVELLEALQPAGTPREVLRALKPFASAGSILLVGHEPNLGELATTLLGGAAGSRVAFKKAGLCRLECTALAPGRGCLHWLLTPGQMLRLR
jgi:phosphohistidine phosphatase